MGQSYLKNAALLTGADVLLRLAGMGLRIYLANALGGEGMGLYQLVLAVYSLFVTLATAGVSVAATRLMAEELAASIAKNKVVDWETRDAVQARLRNVVRVVLRKYGYPQTLREQVVEQVMTLAKLDVVIDGGTF